MIELTRDELTGTAYVRLQAGVPANQAVFGNGAIVVDLDGGGACLGIELLGEVTAADIGELVEACSLDELAVQLLNEVLTVRGVNAPVHVATQAEYSSELALA